MILATQEQEKSLYSLLDYLAQGQHPVDFQWQMWQVNQIAGGANNLLYHATGPLGDFAVKFTIRDWRDRAGREYGTLLALHQAELLLAPKPVLLDRHRYAQPVVVQTWLEGEVLAAPPASETVWQSLLAYYTAIHTFKPDQTKVALPSALINVRNVRSGRQFVARQVAHIPKEAQPASLRALLDRFEKVSLPDWPEIPVALCRGDPNYLNFIHHSGLWSSVDWEASGWGDPAFDIADLMAHPAYLEVPASQWGWIVETYSRLAGDPTAVQRIYTYYKIMLVWWVARLARFLYEVPQGLDERLVQRPSDWLARRQAQYEQYLRLAEAD